MNVTQTLNIISLKGPPRAYKTYKIVAPLATHWRKATCAEFECEAFRIGWNTIVPADSAGAQWIRSGQSGRQFTERQATDEHDVLLIGMTCFMFSPGQEGFAGPQHEHRISLERDPFFIVGAGDYQRGSLRNKRRHANGSDWVDDFATHQDRIAKERN